MNFKKDNKRKKWNWEEPSFKKSLILTMIIFFVGLISIKTLIILAGILLFALLLYGIWELIIF